MTFTPNLSVKEGLDHLAKRLDPIIAFKFAANLGGHQWTVVLDILDEKKGFSSSYQHLTYDLQPQLRMLTERLGDFGFPFDGGAPINQGRAGEECVKLITEVLNEAMITAPPPREPLPDVEKHEVRLVTWLAVKGTRALEETAQ